VKFAYRLTVDRATQVTWHFREVAAGTRLTYEEEFTVEALEKEAFRQLQPAQRRTIQLILYMNIVGMIASTIAIVAWGIAFALQ
jgi:hypothetical protein